MTKDNECIPSITLMNHLLKEASELAKQGRIEEMEAAIKQILGRDLLTDILNRVGFLERLEGDIQSFVETSTEQYQMRRRGDESRRMIRHPLCMAFLDLDRFKCINSDVGYCGGDIVLKVFAQYLAVQFRKSDIVGRVYGDEFALVIRGATEETVRQRLVNIAMKLRDHPWSFADADGCPRLLKNLVTFTVDIVMLNGEEDFEKVLQAFKRAGDGVLEKKKERP